jgi:arginine/lysine/ornithine decarboxylase
MASLDWARAFMESEGQMRIQELLFELKDIKNSLKHHPGLLTIDDYKSRDEIASIDPMRLVLDVRPLGLTGYQAEEFLREDGVQVEMSDVCRIVLICSVADDKAAFKALLAACRNLPESLLKYGSLSNLISKCMSISREMPKQIMSPRKAFYSIIENVPIKESIGRICAGIIGAYPPGVPRFCPGELIDKQGINELLDIQRCGGNLFGLVEGALVPVVSE